MLGLRDGNNGLGNNSEEIETATLLFDNIVIKPYQDLIIDALDEILAVNDITLNLYFKTLQPLEFIEVDKSLQDAKLLKKKRGIKQEDSDFDFELQLARAKRFTGRYI